NYFFRNNGDLTFEEISLASGLVTSDYASGAAYGDLDLDGDIDIAVSNLIEESFIYRNNAHSNGNNFLRVSFQNELGNRMGLGAKVWVTTGGQTQYQELTLTKGFQSSSEPILHFGLGENKVVDTLKVVWPDHAVQILTALTVNQTHIINRKQAGSTGVTLVDKKGQLFKQLSSKDIGINYVHRENEFDDYEKEILLPHKMSQFGPNVTVADVNGDSMDDFYIGGAKGQSGRLFIQETDATFKAHSEATWEKDKEFEDLGSHFIDIDGDKDLDLYIVSGGNESDPNSNYYDDRLYLNDGNGNYKRVVDHLSGINASGACVISADYDNDGDEDLFVGGRQMPGRYPYPGTSFILNNQNGRFTDVTQKIAPALASIGMVSSAIWTDFNTDGQQDLIVVGEWMPITLFKNNNGIFEDVTDQYGLSNTVGWWNKIIQEDFDDDGDMDYVVGNLGLNYKYTATEKEPLHIYCHDFDANGQLDIVIGYYNDGVCYPVRGRQCSSEQIPAIRKNFSSYAQFATANIEEVYGQKLNLALHNEAKMFSSVFLKNQGGQALEISSLPLEAQIAPTFGILTNDFNHDGITDILIAGNFYVSEVETGRADAGTGLLLLGRGDNTFKAIPGRSSGFIADKDVRDLALINLADGSKLILVSNNDDELQVFRNPGKRGKMIP
ncbi:MAG: VCBS repeat-containing protein, partial [Bacteroidetes bacterium]|nr:VCBS repeat-containing protein [Bacteroidota bacterium]